MPLPPGTTVGSYRILASIGAGGMGEVYRARDSKLGRDVALKVLPEAFARDGERMARFQREAKVLASLNHPNIATIHGLEDSGTTHALVMELVEGPTLADRIKAGPIPIDEALRIVKQICEALEYAHERGIVHRDLKPANVKVTSDDAVKILDFGLAKALEGDAASLDMSTSPTISRMATMQGVLLGTAAYMSPEQAKAKPVDRRGDIWAFGCVLYEMLTGKQAFTGETVTDTLAAVIKEEPDWSRLPVGTPVRVRVLLQRCFQKDPKQRLRDIGDGRISLDEVLSCAPETAQSLAPAARPAKHWVIGGIASALTLAALAGVAVWYLKPSPAKPVTRFTITLPPGQRLVTQPALALSPDGTKLAYVAEESGTQRIYVRPMDSGEAKPIAGTEGAYNPFFSPDGQWLGFFADAGLKKVSANGGAPIVLAPASTTPYGAAWNSHGTIVFAPIMEGSLREVPDSGGTAQPLSQSASNQVGQIWPAFLPDGETVLLTGPGAGGGVSAGVGEQQIAAESLRGGERRILGVSGASPQYSPSGHLLFVQSGTLMAAPFDAHRVSVTGPAVPVAQGISSPDLVAGAQYTISQTGTLAFIPGTGGVGGNGGITSKLVWVTRNGAETPVAAPPHNYSDPRVSPDGGTIAIRIAEGGSADIWLFSLARETLSRFTFQAAILPVWTADGKHVAFASPSGAGESIFWQRADGSGGLEQLASKTTFGLPFSFSPDGKLLALIEPPSTTPGGTSIWILRMNDHKADLFLQTASVSDVPKFSPDGRWLAYASDESGRREIYVQPYPGPGGKWQISTDGGNEPVWSPNGRELFYRNQDKMMAVDISTQPAFAAGKPHELFAGDYVRSYAGGPFYDVSRDGNRFLMLKPVGEGAPTQINVVLNWTEELKRLVPTGKQ